MKRSWITVILAVVFVAGCAGVTTPLEKPKTITERIAYVEAGSQAAIKTLADLTCRKYTEVGTCTEAARPLHPARSQSYLETISKARTAARSTAIMTNAGGNCLGERSTPLGCIALAETMLSEVTNVLKTFNR